MHILYIFDLIEDATSLSHNCISVLFCFLVVDGCTNWTMNKKKQHTERTTQKTNKRKDNMDQLGTIVAILGTEDLHAYISKAKINVTPEIRKVIAKYTLRGRGNKKEWSTLIPSPSSSSPNNDNSDNMSSSSSSLEKGKTTKEEGTATTTNANKNVYIPSEDGIDLLSKLLIYDHTNRLTAKQAMDHKFFDSVRGPVNRRIQEQILQSRGFYLN